MTGAPDEAGPLALDVEVVGDGWPDEGLDPADGEREPDEQALSEMTAAASRAAHWGPPRHPVRTTLPIELHSIAEQAGGGP
jgi:hypothetical protein